MQVLGWSRRARRRARALRGVMEAPREGAEVRTNDLVVSGWAFSRDDAAVDVTVRIDGVVVSTHLSATTELRQDVNRTWGRTMSAPAGFTLKVALPEELRAEPGGEAAAGAEHSLQVELKHGRWQRMLPSVTLRVAPLDPVLLGGGLDGPASGSVPVTRQLIHVRGWAVSHPPVSEVLIQVGAASHVARLGLPRPELTDVFWLPDACLGGFEAVLPRTELEAAQDEEHHVQLKVVVRDLEGSEHLLGERVLLLEHRATHPEELGTPSAGDQPAVIRHGGRPRVLVMFHLLQVGGAQLRMVETLEQCAETVDYEVVCGQDGPLRARLERLGIPVHVSEGFPGSTASGMEGRQQELAAWCKPRRYDAVVGLSLLSYTAVDLAHRLGVPGVLDIHESSLREELLGVLDLADPTQRLRLESCHQALLNAARVVFPTRSCRELYPEVSDDRVVIAPAGFPANQTSASISAATRDRPRRVAVASAHDQLVVCIGTTNGYKGQALLLRAAAALAARSLTPEFALVGCTPGPHLTAFQHFQRHHPEVRLTEVGVVDDVSPWLETADWFVTASDTETLPGVVLEAMRANVPVIASDIPGHRELLQDGVSGLLFPRGSVGALTSALQRALLLPDHHRRALASEAARHVAERFASGAREQWFSAGIRALAESRP